MKIILNLNYRKFLPIQQFGQQHLILIIIQRFCKKKKKHKYCHKSYLINFLFCLR